MKKFDELRKEIDDNPRRRAIVEKIKKQLQKEASDSVTIWIDLQSGTWGDSEMIVFINLDRDTYETWCEEDQTDSEIIELAYQRVRETGQVDIRKEKDNGGND